MADLPDYNIDPNRQYAVSGKLLEAVLAEVRRLGKISAYGAVELTNDAGGITIGVKRTTSGSIGLRLVTLAQDGGSDGYAPTTYATWTYTVTDFDTGAVLGHRVSVLAPRMLASDGTVPATLGLARGGSPLGSGSGSGGGSGSGTVQLVWAFEQYGEVTECSGAAGSGSGGGS
jgi:hypothetical protein